MPGWANEEGREGRIGELRGAEGWKPFEAYVVGFKKSYKKAVAQEPAIEPFRPVLIMR